MMAVFRELSRMSRTKVRTAWTSLAGNQACRRALSGFNRTKIGPKYITYPSRMIDYCEAHASRSRQGQAPSVTDTFALIQRPEDSRDAQDDITSVYIHLPFCKKKCLYCDFPVVAVGRNMRGSEQNSMMDAYIDALCKEIEITASNRNILDDSEYNEKSLYEKQRDLPRSGLKTIYFGGGTPSLVSLKCLERILMLLESKFGINRSETAEITIEADPGTFDASTLSSYMNLGITRVSVGVQAFDETLLQICGRSHTLYDVYKSIEDIHASGIPSWSLDLISGLPSLDLELWDKNIHCAIDADPKHISAYDLQIEPGTPFGKSYRPGTFPLPSDEDAAAMYSQASAVLQGAGFEHYELSSYAKPGHQCQHNAVYWDGSGYYAFGMGASSYIQRRRVTRPKKLQHYMAWVERFSDMVHQETTNQILPHLDAPESTPEDMLTDMVMLQLRKSSGLRLDSIIQQYEYGRLIVDTIVDSLTESVERGLVDYDREKQVIKLVDPQGFLLSNDVISDIFVALDEIKQM